MKRVSLELQLRQLDPKTSSSMQEHINTTHALEQEILQAGKAISSEDMAITLLSDLLNKYSTFCSSLLISGRMNVIMWEELVLMVLD